MGEGVKMYAEIIRLVVGWVVLCLPIYLILNKFEFKTFEKIILTFFVSYGLISLLVYWIGKVFNLTIGIILTFVLLVAVKIFWMRKNE